MSKDKFEDIKEGLLTVQMESNSSDFQNFKKFLNSKVESLSQEQKNTIEIQSIRVKMYDYLKSEVKKGAIKEAGEFLRELLSNLNIKQNRFSKYLGIKPSNLNKVLKGNRNVGLEMSLILNEIFGIESNLWLRIQSKNKHLKISKQDMESYKKFKLRDLTKLRESNVG